MKKSILILCGLWLQTSTSRVYHIEVSSDVNAPELSAIVQESLISPPPPFFTLQAFNTATPSEIRYLIDERATGNLRTIMDSHPLWAPSKLQQFLVLIYDDETDPQIVQNSLANDPFINQAYEIKSEDLLPPSVKQGVSNPFIKKKKTTTEQVDIINVIGANIQSAWELSEGMGYIGLIDTGVQLNHPDLRAFDN